jgi:hypothetical protein
LLENGAKKVGAFKLQYHLEKLGAKFAFLLNFHLKPPSYIITRRKQQMRTIAD